MTKDYVVETEIATLEGIESLKIVNRTLKGHFRVQVHHVRIRYSINIHTKGGL